MPQNQSTDEWVSWFVVVMGLPLVGGPETSLAMRIQKQRVSEVVVVGMRRICDGPRGLPEGVHFTLVPTEGL